MIEVDSPDQKLRAIVSALVGDSVYRIGELGRIEGKSGQNGSQLDVERSRSLHSLEESSTKLMWIHAMLNEKIDPQTILDILESVHRRLGKENCGISKPVGSVKE